VPGTAAKKAYLIEKKCSGDKIREVVEKAMAERQEGKTVNLLVMKKNKKFQKEQLEAEGYSEIEEIFAR
jgi:histidyl-tRNA synthetase